MNEWHWFYSLNEIWRNNFKIFANNLQRLINKLIFNVIKFGRKFLNDNELIAFFFSSSCNDVVKYINHYVLLLLGIATWNSSLFIVSLSYLIRNLISSFFNFFTFRKDTRNMDGKFFWTESLNIINWCHLYVLYWCWWKSMLFKINCCRLSAFDSLFLPIYFNPSLQLNLHQTSLSLYFDFEEYTSFLVPKKGSIFAARKKNSKQEHEGNEGTSTWKNYAKNQQPTRNRPRSLEAFDNSEWD